MPTHTCEEALVDNYITTADIQCTLDGLLYYIACAPLLHLALGLHIRCICGLNVHATLLLILILRRPVCIKTHEIIAKAT